jgi:hypothetical protein
LKLLHRVDRERAKLFRQDIPDQPLGNIVDQVLASMRLDSVIQAGVQTLLDGQLRINYGSSSLQDLSLYYYNQDNENVTQVEDRAFPDGFVQVVNALFKASGQKIMYPCPVQKISYNGPNVTVTTSNNTFTAPYCLITVPLGVLQKGSISFDPPLPDWKLCAINRLGMGLFDKFALLFDRNFWGETQFLRTTLDTSHWTVWFNPNTNEEGVTGRPAVVVTAFGDVAACLADEPDDAIVQNQILCVLKGLFGPKVSTPQGFARTKWGKDPYAYGSYPHIPVGATACDYDIMSSPVPCEGPRLFFAGDATHRTHPQSVWGAYESGQREACRIWRTIHGFGRDRFPDKDDARHTRKVWDAYGERQDAIQQQTGDQFPATRPPSPGPKQPNSASATQLRNEGTAQLSIGNYPAAVETLSRAIQENATDWRAYNERGAAYTFLDKDKEAIKDFSLAIELNDRQAVPFRNRGAACLRQGKYAEALADFDRAISLKPDYARAYHERSVVQHKLGHHLEADRDQRQAEKLRLTRGS